MQIARDPNTGALLCKGIGEGDICTIKRHMCIDEGSDCTNEF